MIKTIVPIIFTLYQATLGNRLLLQGQGGGATVIQPELQLTPPNGPPVELLPVELPQTATPGNGSPVDPVAPGGSPAGTPGNGPVEIPPLVDPAVTPGNGQPAGQPAGPPGNVVPAPPAGGMPWATPGNPAAPSPGQAPGQNKIDCTITPPALGTCARERLIATNPNINWELKCGTNVGSCFESIIDINFEAGAFPIEELKGFWFTSQYAAAGATININNLTGRSIRIAEVKCDKAYSCQGLTIFTGPDSFLEEGDMFCNAPGACDNCWIKKDALDAGLPCRAYVEPI